MTKALVRRPKTNIATGRMMPWRRDREEARRRSSQSRREVLRNLVEEWRTGGGNGEEDGEEVEEEKEGERQREGLVVTTFTACV